MQRTTCFIAILLVSLTAAAAPTLAQGIFLSPEPSTTADTSQNQGDEPDPWREPLPREENRKPSTFDAVKLYLDVTIRIIAGLNDIVGIDNSVVAANEYYDDLSEAGIAFGVFDGDFSGLEQIQEDTERIRGLDASSIVDLHDRPNVEWEIITGEETSLRLQALEDLTNRFSANENNLSDLQDTQDRLLEQAVADRSLSNIAHELGLVALDASLDAATRGVVSDGIIGWPIAGGAASLMEIAQALRDRAEAAEAAAQRLQTKIDHHQAEQHWFSNAVGIATAIHQARTRREWFDSHPFLANLLVTWKMWDSAASRGDTARQESLGRVLRSMVDTSTDAEAVTQDNEATKSIDGLTRQEIDQAVDQAFDDASQIGTVATSETEQPSEVPEAGGGWQYFGVAHLPHPNDSSKSVITHDVQSRTNPETGQDEYRSFVKTELEVVDRLPVHFYMDIPSGEVTITEGADVQPTSRGETPSATETTPQGPETGNGEPPADQMPNPCESGELSPDDCYGYYLGLQQVQEEVLADQCSRVSEEGWENTSAECRRWRTRPSPEVDCAEGQVPYLGGCMDPVLATCLEVPTADFCSVAPLIDPLTGCPVGTIPKDELCVPVVAFEQCEGASSNVVLHQLCGLNPAIDCPVGTDPRGDRCVAQTDPCGDPLLSSSPWCWEERRVICEAAYGDGCNPAAAFLTAELPPELTQPGQLLPEIHELPAEIPILGGGIYVGMVGTEAHLSCNFDYGVLFESDGPPEYPAAVLLQRDLLLPEGGREPLATSFLELFEVREMPISDADSAAPAVMDLISMGSDFIYLIVGPQDGLDPESMRALLIGDVLGQVAYDSLLPMVINVGGWINDDRAIDLVPDYDAIGWSLGNALLEEFDGNVVFLETSGVNVDLGELAIMQVAESMIADYGSSLTRSIVDVEGLNELFRQPPAAFVMAHSSMDMVRELVAEAVSAPLSDGIATMPVIVVFDKGFFSSTLPDPVLDDSVMDPDAPDPDQLMMAEVDRKFLRFAASAAGLLARLSVRDGVSLPVLEIGRMTERHIKARELLEQMPDARICFIALPEFVPIE